MIGAYLDLVRMIERSHRQFLELVKNELEKRQINDLNNVQAMLLFNVGDSEVTVGELTNRGYYLGSNVSYNLKKMVEAEYLMQTRSQHDKRSVRVRLSDKGVHVYQELEKIFAGQAEELQKLNVDAATIKEAHKTLSYLGQYWSRAMHQIDTGVA